ncbi:MAG: hypothetical protein H6853_07725 [Rhodospirillales bacterium]|nr:hypothetical protein [Alphaproteobacteria bacterium]USO03408.1 MAG: hypothetical protein H6853_07725 [Rhodospirillales bacterium]
MLDFMNKAEVAARIHDSIQGLCHDEERGIDGMKELLLLSGMMVETAFLFDNCQEALPEMFEKLSRLLACEPLEGVVASKAMPPSTIIDFDTEHGRALAREFFEEWLDCPYEFHEMLLFLIQQIFIRRETQGQSRAESFRLLIEGAHLAMAYELAAQELCDAVIETKIGVNGWTLADSVSGMAGTAGRKLALSHDGKNQCCWFRGTNFPDFLDQTAYVMTQEAVRLGLSTGPDWRFGLPANDVPSNPPTILIQGMESICRGFFAAINMHDPADQAVACAKAAGRMLAVAAGGKTPEMEPAIAKPLAMAALTESYKGVCVEFAAAL